MTEHRRTLPRRVALSALVFGTAADLIGTEPVERLNGGSSVTVTVCELTDARRAFLGPSALRRGRNACRLLLLRTARLLALSSLVVPAFGLLIRPATDTCCVTGSSSWAGGTGWRWCRHG